jgi:hypothetical protein
MESGGCPYALDDERGPFMPKMSIELTADQERKLREIAAAERKSEEELCLEAVEGFLKARGCADVQAPDRYEPLRKMIGLVKEGPTDASVHHDLRPGEEP